MSAGPSLPSVKEFHFHSKVDVRFRDLDAMGHVNNAAYLTFFEVARTEYMMALGHVQTPHPSVAEMFPFVLAEVSCRFLAPASMADRLRIHLRTTRIGGKSFDFEYLVCQESTGALVATGRSVQVYFDYGEQRTLQVPADFRDRIERLEQRSLPG